MGIFIKLISYSCLGPLYTPFHKGITMAYVLVAATAQTNPRNRGFHTFVFQFTGAFSLAQTIANTGRAISLMGAGTLVFSNSTNMYAYKN